MQVLVHRHWRLGLPKEVQFAAVVGPWKLVIGVDKWRVCTKCPDRVGYDTLRFVTGYRRLAGTCYLIVYPEDGRRMLLRNAGIHTPSYITTAIFYTAASRCS